MSFLRHYYFNIDKNFFQVFLHTNVSFEILAQNYFLMTLGIENGEQQSVRRKEKENYFSFISSRNLSSSIILIPSSLALLFLVLVLVMSLFIK